MKSKGIRSVIRSRSLTVTALSNGDSCMISSPMKFQVSQVERESSAILSVARDLRVYFT